MKVSALLALESCAKGAQHYNKQKTILHAFKHLVMFAANLCRKVWVLHSTKVGWHFEISLKVSALLALESCLFWCCKGCTKLQQAKNNSTCF